LVRTKQQWKLHLFYLLMVPTALLLWLMIDGARSEGGSSTYSTLIPIGFVFSGAIAFGWLILSIRCKSCGARPVWTLFRTGHAHDWLTRLNTAEECPVCCSRTDALHH
jgi:hypothetical protein